jgi:hypothetical protein
MLGFILIPIIFYIEKILFLEKNASKKREITQIKCWIELSSLVNRTNLYVLMSKQGQITLDIQITGSSVTPASGSVKFFFHFSKTIKDIHLKLGILVHYRKRNQLQQGR